MTITEIKEHNKKKCKIYVDHEFAFVLYKGELHKYNIKIDEQITESVFRELTEQILPKRAKLRAMNLLTKRPYTEMKLREKLREGLYSEACIDTALAYVKSYGYVDDQAYAEDYIAYHMETQSCKIMEQKLLQKGIDSNTIKECLNHVDAAQQEQMEQEQIRALFDKKYKGEIPQENTDRIKMLQFFTRKGFSPKKVMNTIGELALDNLYN